MDVKDLLNEPEVFDWSCDLREPVRSAPIAMSCDAWWSRACGNLKGKVSKENEFRRGDEEGVSNVRVRDKRSGSLDVLEVGTVTKVESGGVCESETFSSLPSVGVTRDGMMTSLSLGPIDPVKPAQLRALSPSHPLLLDGRLTEELLPAVALSETPPFLLKPKEDDFCFVWRDEEEVSKVRVCDRDKSTAGLDDLDVGTVTKVETGGVCGSETLSSLPSVGVARIGTMTSLILDPLDLLKPAKVKLRALPPSHPLLLDGLSLSTEELLSGVGQSGTLKAKLRPPEGSLAPMWCRTKRTVISPVIHHTALNGPGVCN